MLAIPPPIYNHLGGPEAPVRINVGASSIGHVNLTVPYLNLRESHTIQATVTTFTIDTHIIARTNGKENKGISLEADTDITVHVFIDTKDSGQEGFLALPIGGRDYVVASYTPRRKWAFTSGYIIASSQDNTRILIRSQNTDKVVVLNRFETYQLQTTAFDPSGTVIHSNQAISVFAGSMCPFVPADANGSCSALLDQIPPTDSWGSTYIVPPLENNLINVIRIYTANDSTLVTLTNSTSVNRIYLSSFSYKELIFGKNPLLINSGSNIQVVMYGFTGYTFGSHDAAFMAVLPSMSHFLSEYRFATPNYSGHYPNSLLIIIKQSDQSGLLLNGGSLRYNSVQSLNTPTGLYSILTVSVDKGRENILRHRHQAEFGAVLYSPNGGIGYGYCVGKKLAYSDSEFIFFQHF